MGGGHEVVCQTCFQWLLHGEPGLPGLVIWQPLRRSMAPCRELPAWHHSESSPCRPDPDLAPPLERSGSSASHSAGRVEDGWRRGARTRCTGPPGCSRPPGWPTGEVQIRFLTDKPALGVAPLSNRVLFVLSRTSFAATYSEQFTPGRPTLGTARPQKMSSSMVFGPTE